MAIGDGVAVCALQWGRSIAAAEIPPQPEDLIGEHGFNGAAASLLRKSGALAWTFDMPLKLQWGRSIAAAEIPPLRTPPAHRT